MELLQLSSFLVIGIFFGLFMTFVWDFLERRILLKKVKTEAKFLLEDAQEKCDEFIELSQKGSEKRTENKLNIFNKEKALLKSNIQTIEDRIENKSIELKKQTRLLQSVRDRNESHIKLLVEEKEKMREEEKERKSLIQAHREKQREELKKRMPFQEEALKEEIKKDLREAWKTYVEQKTLVEGLNLEDQNALKKEAGFYLSLALSRFQRAYCPERGIPIVRFKNKHHLESLTAENKKLLEDLEKECGVDVVLNEETLSLSVFGIDPVRREWGRMSLEKISSRTSRLKPSHLKKIIRTSKERLFSKIQSDGLKICKRLKLRNVSPEVRNMMGALRYRYSFAQNQHFHCEEVAWLCGLLSADLGLSFKKGQRAGMFHDIGKAMDHSLGGSHAVIGADFLSQYKESEDIIHAVRAHHYDEVPSSPLAFLVIVADSISGSRPGARRFTEDSYNQKIVSLEKILQSFNVIDDFYIMNAGREIRAIVNPRRVDDKGVIKLSQEISKEIEKECSYPGLIKVSVVRRSEVSAMA